MASASIGHITEFVVTRVLHTARISIYILSPIGHFDIADPRSIQDAYHHELSKYDLCSPRVSQELSG